MFLKLMILWNFIMIHEALENLISISIDYGQITSKNQKIKLI